MTRWLQGLALGTVLIVVVVMGLFRLPPLDVPGHLLLGRLIWEGGAPLTSNLLSWTWPDYPMDQQYPLYQVTCHLMLVHLGWGSLSVLCCVSWCLAVLGWIGWAGGLRTCAESAGLWLLAAIGVQRHLVPRPEAFTVLGLALLLIAWERWRAHPGWRPLAAMVAVQWLMVNTHQLFVVGMVLQVGFVAHLLGTRALAGRGWVDDTDAALPLGPPVVALVASTLALTLSPNGLRVFLAPLALISTVRELGATGVDGPQSAELAPIWTDPIGGPVALVLILLVAVSAWRTRGRWQLYELGVLAVCAAMVLAALRGIPFFALAAAAIATRWGHAARPWLPAGSPVHAARALATLALAATLLGVFVKPRPYVYLQRQQGIGRSVGEWGDHTTAFLRDHPPPGEMMNIGWVAANYLYFDLYPPRRVFVDGRWEAYPKPFLNDCIAMVGDPVKLGQMIETWKPGFLVAEMRAPAQQQRIAELVVSGRARLVHVDSIAAVAALVKPENEDYLAEYGLDPSGVVLPDWLPEHPILHAQQQVRVARLLRFLGEDGAAESLLVEARLHADHPTVRADLATVR